MEDRLEKIETKLSLAEDLLEELNRTIYLQERRIEKMQQELVSLREQMRQSMPAEQRNAADEIPPHY